MMNDMMDIVKDIVSMRKHTIDCDDPQHVPKCSDVFWCNQNQCHPQLLALVLHLMLSLQRGWWWKGGGDDVHYYHIIYDCDDSEGVVMVVDNAYVYLFVAKQEIYDGYVHRHQRNHFEQH